MRKICIFTATRAEWGLLKRLAEEILRAEQLELTLLISGTHLSTGHGMTVKEIEADGFDTRHQVDIQPHDDSPQGICHAMALAIDGYGQFLRESAPDILVILGDRYEALCAATAAQIYNIPVAHIHGGETTEGAIDEAFRHAITKMAHLHFPCCEEYRRRIIQLGEHPHRVFNVGALGVENIRQTPLLSRQELAKSLNFNILRPFLLITYHPVTLETNTARKQIDELLSALETFPDHAVIFTLANADSGGQLINERIKLFEKQTSRCLAVASLGLKRYLSAMQFCDAVVGNSSSGIIEAPMFKIPTINIGDRQKGRMRSPSIIDCPPDKNAIVAALKQALSSEFKRTMEEMTSPFEQDGTVKKIINQLINIDLSNILKKSFFNLTDIPHV